MNIAFIIFFILAMGVFAAMVIISLRFALKDQTIQIGRQVQEQMRQNAQLLQETHSGYSQIVGSVQHRLGELQSATHRMVELGRDIASLQDILRAPKLRGGLGELLLGELLKQILPPEHYQLQYGFSNGCKVDAVIRLGEGLIPVDAKFPLENFRRVLQSTQDEEAAQAGKMFAADVKRHIDSIAAKYILPEEGTFEFALMYIPAENVYYEIIIKDDMRPESPAAYALERRVIPVSPNSFYAYLQTIVHGLKGLRIEQSAQKILRAIGQLEMDLQKCALEFEKLGAHLAHAQSAYEKTGKRFEKLHDKLLALGERHERIADEPLHEAETAKSESTA